ncbi:MAG: hypothetical protein K8R73_04010 [Clostridiales bacterium]|nr:hypothetical protein [Clostridiales bacterium]
MKKCRDGEAYVLQCNSRDQIINFLKIIEYQHPLLDCMRYKLDLESTLIAKKSDYQKKYPKHDVIIDCYK